MSHRPPVTITPGPTAALEIPQEAFMAVLRLED